MFVRRSFITNSSSTSFLFFGITFSDDSFATMSQAIILPEKIGLMDEQQVYNAVFDWSENIKGPISVMLMEGGYIEGAVYAAASRYYLPTSGIQALPLTHMRKCSSTKRLWALQIIEFCHKYGITPDRFDNPDPGWRIACNLNT